MVNVFPLSGTETRSVVRLDRTLVAMRTERSGCQNRTLYTDVKKMELALWFVESEREVLSSVRYTASSGNSLSTVRDSLSVPLPRVKKR